MGRYRANAAVYFVHVDDAISGEQLMRADHDYLAAAAAAGSERRQLLQSAAVAYQKALLHFAVTILKYYIDEPVALETYPKAPRTGKQYNRATIESADPSTYLPTLNAAKQAIVRLTTDPVTHQYTAVRDDYRDDRETYLTYVGRCATRLQVLQSAGATAPAP